MNKYDYSTLNDKELEEFTCELLNAHYKLELQNFKSGQDQGIDLRYAANDNKNSVIVQVKHYTTNFKTLYNKLKSEELKKVQQLNPGTYWFVTSLPLSAKNKDQIKELFTGFIPNTNYILGREDLDRLLSQHKKIEKDWLKLWLTNTSVLQQILNNAIIGRSAFYQDKILNTIKLYVKNPSLSEANKILRKNKFLLITGQPGVGKTTLADILTYEFLAQGFQLIYIDKDINEAEAVYELDKEQPQIFYFDDFLGSNHLEILNPKSSESAIVNFIERIQLSQKKYLIMTTRTTILNDARENYEKLKRARIDMHRKELQLQDYDIVDKGKILYSHLYHSKIEPVYKEEIFKNKNYWKVVKHRNYTPRLIEFFCKPFNLTGISPEKYLAFVLNTLEFPNEIWRHSYTKQLHAEDRFLVGSFYSFGDNYNFSRFSFDAVMRLDCVEIAYNNRVDYEVTHNGHVRVADSFLNSLRRLLDGYLINYYTKESSVSMLSFINPSIGDFLKSYYSTSNEEKWKLVKGAVYITQLKFCYSKLFIYGNLGFDNYLAATTEFLDYVEPNINKFLPVIHLEENSKIPYDSAFRCEIMELLHKFRFTEEINERVDVLITKLLEGLNLDEINYDCYKIIIALIEETDEDSLLEAFVEKNWDNLIMKLWPHASSIDVAEEIGELFKTYNKDVGNFANESFAKDLIYNTFKSRADDETESLIYDREDKIKSVEELEALKEEVQRTRDEIFRSFELKDESYDENYYFGDFNIEELIKTNKSRKKKKVILSKPKEVKEKANQAEMERKVDDLFTQIELPLIL